MSGRADPEAAFSTRAGAKVAVRLGCDMPLDTGLAREREAIAHVLASDDATEGIVAFGDKRTPAFQGRQPAFPAG